MVVTPSQLLHFAIALVNHLLYIHHRVKNHSVVSRSFFFVRLVDDGSFISQIALVGLILSISLL